MLGKLAILGSGAVKILFEVFYTSKRLLYLFFIFIGVP
ncbi:hypothetical protein FPSM_01183 [Flavobacterium psychrophilum]|nr:hypothetical protein FPSM_01183 [Flavobacterium psychrophilum]